LTVQSTFISIFNDPFYNVYCFNLRNPSEKNQVKSAIKMETKEKFSFFFSRARRSKKMGVLHN